MMAELRHAWGWDGQFHTVDDRGYALCGADLKSGATGTDILDQWTRRCSMCFQIEAQGRFDEEEQHG